MSAGCMSALGKKRTRERWNEVVEAISAKLTRRHLEWKEECAMDTDAKPL